MTITTAVVECSRRNYCRRVLFGTPTGVRAVSDGRVCYFEAGAIVAYEIVHERRAFGCVFRAAERECDVIAVPGVQPAVRMLIAFCRGQRFSRALALLQELGSRGTLDELPDAAFLRAAVALGSRVSTALLADAISHPVGRPWIC